VSAKYWGLTFQ